VEIAVEEIVVVAIAAAATAEALVATASPAMGMMTVAQEAHGALAMEALLQEEATAEAQEDMAVATRQALSEVAAVHTLHPLEALTRLHLVEVSVHQLPQHLASVVPALQAAHLTRCLPWVSQPTLLRMISRTSSLRTRCAPSRSSS
jgi:hypothetical protein